MMLPPGGFIPRGVAGKRDGDDVPCIHQRLDRTIYRRDSRAWNETPGGDQHLPRIERAIGLVEDSLDRRTLPGVSLHGP
jgi:hypothetical protein